MSMAEFNACIDGWNRANGGKTHMSDDEFLELAAVIDEHYAEQGLDGPDA